MPHTPPLFSPTSNPPTSPPAGMSPDRSSDPAAAPSQHQQSDLPQELLQNGWRKCWSNRERRWYFFNKLTQETRWEPPTVASDPGNGAGQPQPQPYRKFVPCDDWNLNIASNVKMPERVPLAAFAPHPEMEVLRAQFIARLRAYILELCHSKDSKCVEFSGLFFGYGVSFVSVLDPPPDTLNQWVMERKTKIDQLSCEQELPFAASAEDVSPALRR